MEWISVKDKMPEPYLPVLVYNPNEKEDNKFSVDFLFTSIDGNLYWDWNTNTDTGELLVTLWMPIPELPGDFII
jgi:hypothetical protein